MFEDDFYIFISPLHYYLSPNLFKFLIKFNPVEYFNLRLIVFSFPPGAAGVLHERRPAAPGPRRPPEGAGPGHHRGTERQVGGEDRGGSRGVPR